MRRLFILLIATIFLGPLGALLFQANSEVFRTVLQSTALMRSIKVTLISGGVGAFFSVVFGLFFAREFALYSWRGKRLQRLLLLFPYLVPNFILATAYVVAWNPGTGLLNPYFMFPGGLYGLSGMTFLFAMVHAPVAFLMAESKIRRIDSSLIEAAVLSGASSWKIFTRIELPLLKPTVAGAFGLCFALNLSAFAIPAWIGAPERCYPLTYKVYQAIQVGGPQGLPKAVVFSFILFLLAIPPLVLSSWAGKNEKIYAVLSGKAAKESNANRSPPWFFAFQTIFVLSQVIFFVAPIFCLFLSTLFKPGCLQQEGVQCFKEISLHSYGYVLFELSETRSAFNTSLIYGSLSSLLIMALVTLSLGLLFKRPKLLRAMEWVFAIPVATPGAILALALIVSFSGRYGINLYNTAWILVLAFVIKHANLAFQPVRTGLSNISDSLLEAARLSGSSTLQNWRYIVFPILSPEILGGLFLVLIPILGELTMSVFLSSPQFRSIGTLLFDLQDYADQSSAAALSVILLFVILALNEISRFISKGKLGY